MRLLRPLLISLLVALVLIVAAAFSPIVQTWLVQRELARMPGLQASVGSVWAGLSGVEISNLRLERDGVILAVPELDARVPMPAALWNKRWAVSHLVAKGWTLDCSHATVRPPVTAPQAAANAAVAGQGPASAPPPNPQSAAASLSGFLRDWKLPVDGSFDGVELEGDVVLPTGASTPPVRVHSIVIGGGVGAGRTGRFSLDANGTSANATPRLQTAAAHGDLELALDPSRRVTRIAFRGTLTSLEESLPKDFTVAAAIEAAQPGRPETYTLELDRGERRVIAVAAHLPAAENRFVGTWTAAVRDQEVAVFFPDTPLPALAAEGTGQFDTRTGFHDLHASGTLTGTTLDWSHAPSALRRVGPCSFRLEFDGARRQGRLELDRADVTFTTTIPVASAKALQPVTIDVRSGRVEPRDPHADWLQVHLDALPAAWLPPLPDAHVFAQGAIRGAVILRAGADGLTLRSTEPLSGDGLVLRLGNRDVKFDASADLLGSRTSAKGWEIRCQPLVVRKADRALVTFRGTVRPLAAPYEGAAVAGNIAADPEALAAQAGAARPSWLRGRAVTADFTANVGAAGDLTATVKVVGHDPATSLTATIGATFDGYRSVSLHAPFTVTAHGATSELALDGSWAEIAGERRIDLTLSGKRVEFEHLQLLAPSVRLPDGRSLASLAATLARPDAKRAAAPGRTTPRDTQPFWGNLRGRFRFDVHQLEIGSLELNEVAATLGFAADALRLNGARASYNPIDTKKVLRRDQMDTAVEPISAYAASGELRFDPAAAEPYALEANGSINIIDGARLFGRAFNTRLEGRWAVAATVKAQGGTLGDLLRQRREEIHLTSDGGALRLLKTNIGDAIPDAPTPVSDAAVKVGSAVGWLFGVNRDAFNRENHLSKGTDAILNFSYRIGEIPYQHATIDLARGADQAIRIVNVQIDAPNDRLTGSGEIAYQAGQPISQRPLSLALKLAVRGPSAEQLADTSLLASAKDADGYRPFKEPLRFTGRLDEVNASAWHDLLARAAVEAGKAGKPK